MTMANADRQQILIVDDLPDNIQVLANILKQEYRLFYATDARRATP